MRIFGAFICGYFAFTFTACSVSLLFLLLIGPSSNSIIGLMLGIIVTALIALGLWRKMFKLLKKPKPSPPEPITEQPVIRSVPKPMCSEPSKVETTANTKQYSYSDTSTHSTDPLIQLIVSMIQEGKSLHQITEAVVQRTSWDYSETYDKVTIFVSAYHVAADMESYRQGGYEYYEFMASLDDKTCPICGHLDGKHFHISQAQPGVNCPPMHFGCRCCTVAYDPEDEADCIAAGIPYHRKTYNEWSKQRPYILIEESYEVIRKTKDVGVFLSRYQFLLETAQEIDLDSFNRFSSLYSDLLKEFIGRYQEDANKLKTERGRKNRMDKLASSLANHKTQYECMVSANYSTAFRLGYKPPDSLD